MTTNKNAIDMTCGIYDTEITCIRHRDGSTTIRAPYIKWINNTGNLAFRKFRVTGAASKVARRLFDAGKIADETGVTLWDLDRYTF